MTTTVQLLGADPATRDDLAERIAQPGRAAPAGTTWQDRLVLGTEVRDLDTTTEGGYTFMRMKVVPYDEQASIGWFLESFRAGSLSKSIADAAKVKRMLPLNLFHDNRSFPIGAAEEWTEEKKGLIGAYRIDQSERAQEAARLADDGLLTGASIEFSPIRSEWEFVDDWNPSLGPEHMDRVVRIEARLGAVGLVQTPAYVSAGVELVRASDARRRGQAMDDARQAPHLTEWRAELERLRG